MAESAHSVQDELRGLASDEIARSSAWFFKTGPGGYGEGDVFIGVRVPAVRKVAARFRDLPLPEVQRLLDSEVHEDRLAALVILVERFRAAGRGRQPDERIRAELHSFYLANVHAGRVDNWDLVDVSAEHLVGGWVSPDDTALLRDLAAGDLWERRVAMTATFGLLKRGDSAATYEIASLLLDDPEPLLHKAVGWMLREAGKRVSREQLLEYLEENAPRMPRTMLSYATEHLDVEDRARLRAMPRVRPAR